MWWQNINDRIGGIPICKNSDLQISRVKLKKHSLNLRSEGGKLKYYTVIFGEKVKKIW